MLYSDEEYRLFSSELEGASIGTVWSAMIPENFNRENLTYEEKKLLFFEIVLRLMQDNKIKLGKCGEFLNGSAEELIAQYKSAFPKTEDEWKAKHEDVWFYEDDCPGGIVWLHENGDEDWT
ncbi:DUF596 domain-containing protein [Serratia sp. JUb9]|uniref:DUF596 domain-containing protein n=1 Tax=Serratia sp. JUb9 TaxID=2724469 RepID=UPI00164E76DA|nr:DUF596 domain-containing protein [Serratia sp. JUb9]QNK34199.1 DUF596 domain-containing protein [Serratia sp. JUb9]